MDDVGADPNTGTTEHPDTAEVVATRSALRPWLPAIILVAILVVSAVAFALSANLFKPTNGSAPAAAQAQRMPAIDRPYSGAAPTRPGDRGGWEQLALLGLLVTALGGGTAGLVYSSRRAKRRALDAGTG